MKFKEQVEKLFDNYIRMFKQYYTKEGTLYNNCDGEFKIIQEEKVKLLEELKKELGLKR